MGHFGREPIRIAWFSLVAAGAGRSTTSARARCCWRTRKRASIRSIVSAPGWGLYPLVVLSTCATVIASQAVISGAFSLTQQAIQLGYSPRFDIHHTSAHEKGQVYIPEVNWLLMLAHRRPGVRLPDVDQSRRRLRHGRDDDDGDHDDAGVRRGARALGLERVARACVVTGAFLVIDLAFFGANVIKIEHGGWFPLLLAGARLRRDDDVAHRPPGRGEAAGRDRSAAVGVLRERSRRKPPVRVPGTGIFMTARPKGAPPILVHHLTHNKVLHEQVVLLTVSIVDVPTVDPDGGDRSRPAPERLLPRGRAIRLHGAAGRAGGAGASAGEGAGRGTRADTTYYLAHLTLFVHARLGMMRLARQAVRLPVAQRPPRHQLLPDSARSRRRDRHSAGNLRPGRTG